MSESNSTRETEQRQKANEETEEELFSRDPDQTTPLMDSPDAPPPDKLRFGVTAKDAFEGQHMEADDRDPDDSITPTAYAAADPNQLDEPSRADTRERGQD